ncbi:hypothetical protein [Aestuariivirga litoralis]|uniref:hypothetical protein n=1 Tax=Aestuariivirga litoralis TaxID=2650924 RepID=UPI0018C70332|nr:hypothetical protein [Aestuariivirga litoralis]
MAAEGINATPAPIAKNVLREIIFMPSGSLAFTSEGHKTCLLNDEDDGKFRRMND